MRRAANHARLPAFLSISITVLNMSNPALCKPSSTFTHLSTRPDPHDLTHGEPLLADLAGRVTDGARCFLAQQHQAVVLSLLTHFPEALAAHLEGRADAAEPFPIVALDDIVDGEAVLALDELDLAPDWADGSAESPSDRIDVRAR